MSDYQLPKTACIITTILPFRVCIICEIIRKEVFHSLTLWIWKLPVCARGLQKYIKAAKPQEYLSTVSL
jgi:hypothetical protein